MIVVDSNKNKFVINQSKSDNIFNNSNYITTESMTISGNKAIDTTDKTNNGGNKDNG